MPKTKTISGKGKGKRIDDRFVSDKARQRYEGAIARKDKGVIPERGITAFQAGQWSRGRHWEMFMSEPPHLAIEPLVREFYANFPDCESGQIFVRGIDVPITAQVINEFFRIPPVYRDEYLEFRRASIDDEEILRVIAKPGTTWDISKKGKRSIKGTNLIPLARLWQYFICARMVPETHYSSVVFERAVLLYCIATGKSMDVGEIIMQSIRHAATPGRGSYAFPHLITELCVRAGVQKTDDEPLIHPAPQLDSAYYQRLLGRPTSDPSSATKKRKGPSASATSSSTTTAKDLMQQVLREVKRSQQQQHWLAEQTKMVYEMQRASLTHQGIDVSKFQWEDWDSDAWPISEDEDSGTEEDENEE